MQKHLIIIGEPCSGKTFLANAITADCKEHQKLTFICKGLPPVKIGMWCNRATKFIIADGVITMRHLEPFLRATTEGVFLKQGFGDDVLIRPKIIIVLDVNHTINLEDASIQRRFDFIDTGNGSIHGLMKVIHDFRLSEIEQKS